MAEGFSLVWWGGVRGGKRGFHTRHDLRILGAVLCGVWERGNAFRRRDGGGGRGEGGREG